VRRPIWHNCSSMIALFSKGCSARRKLRSCGPWKYRSAIAALRDGVLMQVFSCWIFLLSPRLR
jgi:hypothetical protein